MSSGPRLTLGATREEVEAVLFELGAEGIELVTVVPDKQG
jgi:hypothetical protein